MEANGLKCFGKVAGLIGLVLLVPLTVFIFALSDGIPFLEGDDRIIKGRGYGFEIGMTREQAFEVIKDDYDKDAYYLRVLWHKDSEVNEKLEPFENTDLAEYKHREYGEYKVLIQDVENTTLPLDSVARWDIQMPSDWVHSIYLTFDNDHLVEIMRSRWLFERP